MDKIIRLKLDIKFEDNPELHGLGELRAGFAEIIGDTDGIELMDDEYEDVTDIYPKS